MPPWLRRWIPTREQILATRALAPFARHLGDERLWSPDRKSVARAVSIGLFFGLMIPFAQFLFAILTALLLRAHIVTSAACTLITNPFTFPPIYWAAYELGSLVLAKPSAPAEASQIEQSAGRIGELATGWLEGFWIWLGAAGLPLVTGLFIMACTASLLGYLAVHLLWRERNH
ncbi:DUF2062 domain-containing protein [Methyloversatilis thermotolerans]|uniref:DUF2062 domain-containing protein n=1 Tax=Methyloversatilis thermotolerans TaxID=1346290 RepID=UPI000476AE4D|nr:DUF2062 domain-containing protein [Methyloversatilis thermotolerans]